MNIVDLNRDYKSYISYLYILDYKAYILILSKDRLRSKKLDLYTEIRILIKYKREYIY